MNKPEHTSGPVATLPNSSHSAHGCMCDEHPEVPAVKRIQGETDSFGAEYHYMCQPCLDKYREEAAAERARPKPCDWCTNTTTDTVPHRDFEEGRGGPVYQVCAACRKRESDELREEMNSRYDYDDYDD